MTAPALSTPTPFGRYYIHPNRSYQVPSITNIKDKRNIPGLKYWAARQAAEYAADNLTKLQMLERDEAIELIRKHPFTHKDDGPSAIGDMVHDWIDRHIKGDEIPADEIEAAPVSARHMWVQFGAVVEQYQPKWVESEFTVWSDKFGYAGTADWCAYIGNALVLGDTKSGKEVYDDVALQLSALAHADFILEANGNERPLPQFERYAVLHVRPRGAKLIPVEGIDAAFKAFLGLKELFDFERENGGKILMFAPRISRHIPGAKVA